jgi:N-acyl homoserine lactone hydrolase
MERYPDPILRRPHVDRAHRADASCRWSVAGACAWEDVGVSDLVSMPRIDVLELARVEAVPEFHPEYHRFVPFPVNAFLIHHPDGVIVVDTGIGYDSDLIDALYPHTSVALLDELHRCGVDERDVRLIVNSHLHFDHCGQNHALSCPVAVQHAELEAAREPLYTVQAWATVPADRERMLNGDTELCAGVRVLLTPGHTPGHQALVIKAGGEVVVIAAQCVYRRAAWHGEIEPSNLHDEGWRIEAAESVARLRGLNPRRVLLSHDMPIG